MRKSKVRLAISILLTFILVKAIGQIPVSKSQYRYRTFTTKHGKSHNSTLDIVQDPDGFLWFASHNGLDRFDGYDFNSYQNNPDDSTSLPYNRVSSFCIDKDQNFWIGTAGMGLARYIPEKDAFESFTFIQENGEFIKRENDITSLLDLKNGHLLIGTRGGQVNIFDIENSAFSNVPIYLANGSKSNSYTVVRDVCMAKNGDVWVDTSAGLLLYDMKNQVLNDHYKHHGDLVNHLNNTSQMTIDKNGIVWTVTLDGIIWKFDPQEYHGGEKELVFKKTAFNINGLALSIFMNSKNELMVGAQDGLYFFDVENKTASLSRNISGNDKSLSSNRIECIYEDDQGNVFMGTDNEGITILDLHQKNFLSFNNNPLNRTSLLDNYVHGFTKDQQGNLWVGSNLGVSKFNVGKQNFTNHSFQDIDGFQPKVNAICAGNYPYLWIGTSFGLMKYNTISRSHKWFKHTSENGSLSNNEVFSLLLDRDKESLWIGTWGSGIDKLNIKNETVQNFDIDSVNFLYNAILAIRQDKEDNLWLGTYKHGVVKLSPDFKEIRYYNSDKDSTNELGDNVIISMYIDEFGTILAGTTSSGIAYYNQDKDAFKALRVDGKIVNMEIKGAITDEQNNIWASTSKGITKFLFDPPRSGNRMPLAQMSSTILSYTADDGLQSEIFYKQSFYKDDKGLLYFGGANGFNLFNPNEIVKNPHSSSTNITSLKIFNQDLKPGVQINGRVLLEKPIYQTENIVLNYSENSLSFEFSAMNLVNPEKIQYQYKLQGLENEWISTDYSGRNVTYSNLTPNTYEFMVKATNADGDWNQGTASLKIDILPPWWKTKWFLISSIFLTISIIVFIVKIREFNLKKSKRRLEKMVEKRTTEVVEQSKEIQAQNEELQAMNEEMQAQSETLSTQNDQLTETQKLLIEAQNELKNLNNLLEGKVKSRTAHLEKVINELDMFVYSASHDLGAPLKSLMGLVKLTKTENKDQQLEENLDHMQSSILRLENVIASLKQYSRNSSLNITLEAIDLGKLIRDTLSELKYLANFDAIDLQINIPDKTIIQSDSQRIKSVVLNLLDNAIKYSDSTKPIQYIKINYIKEPKHWLLQFEDNGIGISEKHSQGVFDMFQRATEQSTGSGLGLFIVKESLAKLQGKVDIESTEGIGTKITIAHPDIVVPQD